MSANMNIRIEMRVEGLAEVERWLDTKFPDLLEDASNEALDVTLDDSIRKAKELVRVDTGALQKSIRKERRSRPAGFFVYQGFRAGGHIRNPKTGKLVDYARPNEYGTSKMLPQPFMRPAFKYGLKRFKGHFRKSWNRRRPR